MAFNTNAWHEADRAVFGALVTALDGSEEGRNAFCGELPDLYNAWSYISGGGASQGPWNQAMRVLRMDAVIVGRFIEQSVAKAFAMQVVGVLRGPFESAAPVTVFRGAGQQPTVKRDFIEVANQDRLVPVWVAEIPCELVFSTETV